MKYFLAIILIFSLSTLSYSSDSPLKLYQPSFPCEKAKTRTEKDICSSNEISALDSILSETYKAAKSRAQSKELKTEQRSWLKNRNKCSSSNTKICLLSIYASRIRSLNQEYNLQTSHSEHAYYIEKYALQPLKSTGNDNEINADIQFGESNLLEIQWLDENINKKSKWSLDRSGFFSLIDGHCGLPKNCKVKKIKLYKYSNNCLIAKDIYTNNFISIKRKHDLPCTNRKKLILTKDANHKFKFEEGEIKLNEKYFNNTEFYSNSLKISDNSDLLLYVRENRTHLGIHKFQSIIRINPKNKKAKEYIVLSDSNLVSDFYRDSLIISIDSNWDSIFKTRNTDPAGNSTFLLSEDGTPIPLKYTYKHDIKNEISGCTTFEGVAIRDGKIKFIGANSTVCGGFSPELTGNLNDDFELNITSYKDKRSSIGINYENVNLINHETSECDTYRNKSASCDSNNSFMEARLHDNKILLIPLRNSHTEIKNLVDHKHEMFHGNGKKLKNHPRIISKIKKSNKELNIEIDSINFEDQVNIKLKVLPSYYSKNYDNFYEHQVPKVDLGYFYTSVLMGRVITQGHSNINGIKNAFVHSEAPKVTSTYKKNKRIINIPLQDLPLLSLSSEKQCLSISIDANSNNNTFYNYILHDKSNKNSVFCFNSNKNISIDTFEQKNYITNNNVSNYSIAHFNGESFIPYFSIDGKEYKEFEKYKDIEITPFNITKLPEYESSKMTFKSATGESWCKPEATYFSKDLEALIIFSYCGGSHPWNEVSIINKNGSNSLIDGFNYHQYCYRCEKQKRININDVSLHKSSDFHILKVDNTTILFNKNNQALKANISKSLNQTIKIESRNLLKPENTQRNTQNYSFKLSESLLMNDKRLSFESKKYKSRFSQTYLFDKNTVNCIDNHLIDVAFNNKNRFNYNCTEGGKYVLPDNTFVESIGSSNSEEDPYEIDQKDHEKVVDLRIKIKEEGNDFSNYKNLKKLKLHYPHNLDLSKIKLSNLPNTIESYEGPFLFDELKNLPNLKEIITKPFRENLKGKTILEPHFSNLKIIKLKGCNTNWPKFNYVESIELECNYRFNGNKLPNYPSLKEISLKGEITRDTLKEVYKLINLKKIKLFPTKKTNFGYFEDSPIDFSSNITDLLINQRHIELFASDLSGINKFKNLENINLEVSSLIGLGNIVKDLEIKSFSLKMYNHDAYEDKDLEFIYSLKKLVVKTKLCLNNKNDFINLEYLSIKDPCFLGLDPNLSKFASLRHLKIKDQIEKNILPNISKSLTSLELPQFSEHAYSKDSEINFNKNLDLTINYKSNKIPYSLLNKQGINNIRIGTKKDFTMLIDKVSFLKNLNRITKNQKIIDSILNSCIKNPPVSENSYYSTNPYCINKGYDLVNI